jgi:hypothetical protein
MDRVRLVVITTHSKHRLRITNVTTMYEMYVAITAVYITHPSSRGI